MHLGEALDLDGDSTPGDVTGGITSPAQDPGALPPPGEFARDALRCLARIETGYRPDASSDDLDHAVSAFMRSCFDLMVQFAPNARAAFARVLPLTELELAMILDQEILDNPRVSNALTRRLGEWATRSPVFVDEAPVHIITFLAHLRPNLDTWWEREQVDEALARASRLQSAG